MKRVLVIGCPGAGKSTFARRLHEKTALPLFYLDMLWHKKDRTTAMIQHFDNRIKQIMKQDCWIIDGNYQRTLEMRIQCCDTVFLLDYPVEVCLEGARGRVGKPREDMPWVEQELDEELKAWIIDFSNEALPEIYGLLERYSDKINAVVFKSRHQADLFLDGIK